MQLSFRKGLVVATLLVRLGCLCFRSPCSFGLEAASFDLKGRTRVQTSKASAPAAKFMPGSRLSNPKLIDSFNVV